MGGVGIAPQQAGAVVDTELGAAAPVHGDVLGDAMG